MGIKPIKMGPNHFRDARYCLVPAVVYIVESKDCSMGEKLGLWADALCPYGFQSI